ncbi:DENN domain-containing protein 2C-like [Artemia franciscana]|uniref:UDENN domain-containing protein n=1 Tax=Artemia franciscana TaxID=6661 RepID=A0AA88HXF0_ARTSF|nr:hypothetical protein QYM36_010392 [Artemia franciscana]KAK2715809.1 hypothetical protein QYM36_010392 [Artemia franciscana]
MLESNSPSQPLSVTKIKQKLEQLEKEKYVTNYEREKGIPPQLSKNGTLKLKSENSSSDEAHRFGCNQALSDSDSNSIEQEAIPYSHAAQPEYVELQIKNWLFSDDPDAQVQSNSEVVSVNSCSSEVTSISGHSNSYVQLCPPPLPTLPPPPLKPKRTFLHDEFGSSSQASTPCSTLSVPESGDDCALIRFFGPTISHYFEDELGTILRKNGENSDANFKEDEEESDWSDSVESLPVDENKNFVDERRRYLELAKSTTNLNRRTSILSRNSLIPEPKIEGGENNLCRAGFLLGLTCKGSKLDANVLFSVPENIVIDEGLRKMCFPDALHWEPFGTALDYYTIVLTKENGDQYFAHCHRVKIEGFDTTTPYSYCLISSHRCTAFFKEILSELSKSHGLPLEERRSFMSYLCSSPLPPPGRALTIPNKDLTLKRSFDWRFSELGLDFLYQRLNQESSAKKFIDLLSTLLLERKVILVGKNVSEISLAIQGLMNMIAPLEWQYNLVSILPSDMVRMTELPTPYIMGLLSVDEEITPPDFGMIINVDSSAVLHSTGDEGTILPKSVRKSLRSRLKDAKHMKLHPIGTTARGYLSDALLITMAELFGHYRESLVSNEDGTVKFSRETFVRSHPDADCRQFLEWFVDTMMFQSFIKKKCDKQVPESPIEGAFDRKSLQKSMQIRENQALRVPTKNKLVKFAEKFKNKWSGST